MTFLGGKHLTGAHGNVAKLVLSGRTLAGLSSVLGRPARASAVTVTATARGGTQAPRGPFGPGAIHCQAKKKKSTKVVTQGPEDQFSWISQRRNEEVTWADGGVVARPVFTQRSGALGGEGGSGAETRAALPAFPARRRAGAPRGPLIRLGVC